MPRRARGFTLIEVLTAIVVLSVGLLGLGLLLGTSVRSNHNGMLHTQATFAAETMLDRMRANIPGVWGNAYDGTWDAATAPPGVACTAAGCWGSGTGWSGAPGRAGGVMGAAGGF